MKGYYKKQTEKGMIKETHGGHDVHFHEDLEILCCLEGSIGVSVNGTEYTLLPGDMSVAFPNVHHGYLVTEEPNRCIVLVFLPEPEDEFYAELNGMLPKCPVLRKGELPEAANVILQQIFSFFGNGQDGDRRLFRAYARVLTLLIMPSLELVMREPLYSPDTLQTVTHYVSGHFKEPITLNGMAKALGMSPSTLSHVFSGQLKTSFTEYVNTQRVSYAKNKLRKGNMELKEIIGRSGFSSARTFFRVFRASTGMTPTQYRNAGKLLGKKNAEEVRRAK